MKVLFVAFLLLLSFKAEGQSIYKAQIHNRLTTVPIFGATISTLSSTRGASADEHGFVFLAVPDSGLLVVQIRAVGFAVQIDTLRLPQEKGDTVRYALDPVDLQGEEVVVTATRSSRTIADIPTRLEIIAGEELEEKANMKPGDIRMTLNESTGIMAQQTSATSGNALIRIQGLDGRYTQILKDGMPLYGGFSSGLGLLQTPPLDLKQIEVIKGSASTLYGGGAVAGLVNLVSRAPGNKPETRILVNGTTAGGLDVNVYRAQRTGKIGYTIYAARNSNYAYDPSQTGFTAIPRFSRYTLAPRVYIYPDEKTTLWLGLNGSTEDRVGGDIRYARGSRDTGLYFERNTTTRLSGQLSAERHVSEKITGRLKSSINRFDRRTTQPSYLFSGLQTNTFAEASVAADLGKTEWIGGFNLWTDNFTERGNPTDSLGAAIPRRTYDRFIVGAFVQNTYEPTHWLSLETGLRADHVRDFGWALLPRFSLLLKLPAGFSSRIGGGVGYKTPDIFTEDAERRLYKGVLPVNSIVNKLERSYGGQADINYTRSWFNGDLSFSLNQLFFYTLIESPLVLVQRTGGTARLINIDGQVETAGIETNARLAFKEYKLFFGYTLTRAFVHQQSQASRENYLTPSHRINTVLFYELDSVWKIGLEAYYFSNQLLSDGSRGKDYWIFGFMAERLFEHFSIFANLENFLDVRQSRFDSFYTGSRQNPTFRDIYAPLDGFVINAGAKINL